jgi:hypothetical protein
MSCDKVLHKAAANSGRVRILECWGRPRELLGPSRERQSGSSGTGLMRGLMTRPCQFSASKAKVNAVAVASRIQSRRSVRPVSAPDSDTRVVLTQPVSSALCFGCHLGVLSRERHRFVLRLLGELDQTS